MIQKILLQIENSVIYFKYSETNFFENINVLNASYIFCVATSLLL